MAYFKDLSPYEYLPTSSKSKLINIGWLSSCKKHPKGQISKELVSKVEKLVKSPVNLCRGEHYCELCPPPVFETEDNSLISKLINKCASGSGEIWVKGKNSIIYVAPILIAHYIKEHNYKPPIEFLDALNDMNH